MKKGIFVGAVIVLFVLNGSALVKAEDLVISNIDPSTYVIQYNCLALGQPVYMDRDFVFTYIEDMWGSTYIETSNDDKDSIPNNSLSFDINIPATVYVVHDDTITSKPSWLDLFSDTGKDFITNDNDKIFSLYEKDFDEGTVLLGYNGGGASSSMYSVVVVPIVKNIPGPAGVLYPIENSTNVPPNQVTLGWTKGWGAVSHNVYFGKSEPLTFIGNQSIETYSAGLLEDNTTYYWRIDEVNDEGTMPGPVWSFTTGTAFISSNTPLVANGAVAYWGARAAVSDPATAHIFTAADVDGTVAGQNLTLNRTESPGAPLWVYECDAVSTATKSTSHTIALSIPIDLRGWTWWDDPSTSRTIETDGQYYNICTYASIYTSEYPIAAVSNGTNAICLAIPLEPARPVRFVYDAKNLELRAEFDFGFYYSATNPGMFFDNRADATVYAYQVSGQTQAFRYALDTFYDIHEQELVRREGTAGVFVTKTSPEMIDNIEDFHIAYNDYGFHGIRHYEYGDFYRLDWNEEHGIKGFVYQLPSTSYRSVERSYSGTFNATFDGDPADTGGLKLGTDPDGSVTYTADKAVIDPYGKLTIFGFTDRDDAERLVVQFTIVNMDDFATVTESMMGVNVGSRLFGLKRSAGLYGTGDVWKAGAWSYNYDTLGGWLDTYDGKAIPSCSTVTIKLVCSSNFDDCTYVWASYDGGDFEYVGRLILGGQWTSGYETLSVYNNSEVALEIDDLIVTHYSGSTPPDTYSSYFAQYEEDRDMGNPEQQAGAVSYARDKDGNLIQGWSYGGLYPFYVNLDVVHPDSSWPYMSFYEYIREFYLAESLGWDDWPAAKSSGYFHDLTLTGIFFMDFDKTHFAVATNPLTFDRSNNNAPCIGGLWSDHAFVRAVANEHHDHGQVTNLNGPFGDSTYRNYLMMAYTDISGDEVWWDDTGGNFIPPSRTDFLHDRSCAARRPHWLLAYSYDGFASQSVCLKYMQLCMFYGMFPSFVQDLYSWGYDAFYWTRPDLYNRDRAYWDLYIPVIQKIDNAGWEPVTHATVNNDCYIERWGNVSTKDLYFTVYNPSDSADSTVQVDLQGDNLGLYERVKATPLIDTVNPVTVLNGASTTPTLEFLIGPQECRVIKIEIVMKEDINTDGSVDVLDFLYLAKYWLQADPPDGDFVEDGVINLRDFAELADVWLEDSIL